MCYADDEVREPMKTPQPEPEVVHEALQDTDTVARYLHAIADGLASGNLRFSNEDLELQLHPRGLVAFELAVGKERGRARVRLRLTWREDPKKDATEGLEISSR
jgi:amphi-Trp domain-containing protein